MPRSPKTIDSARKLLVSTRVEALRAGHPQKLTLLRDNATIEQALQELAKLMVLSAPVVSCASDTVSVATDPTWPMGTPADDTLGFLDIRDILCSFLHGKTRACLAALLAIVSCPSPWLAGSPCLPCHRYSLTSIPWDPQISRRRPRLGTWPR